MTLMERDALITKEVVKKAERVTDYHIRRFSVIGTLHDDLYSAAFGGLFKASRKFNFVGSFWGFAYQYVNYAIIDEIREQRGTKSRNAEGFIASKKLYELSEWEQPPTVDRRFDRFADREYLLSLAPDRRTREVIILRLLGLTESEIGDRVGVSEARISQIIHSLKPHEKGNRDYPTRV